MAMAIGTIIKSPLFHGFSAGILTAAAIRATVAYFRARRTAAQQAAQPLTPFLDAIPADVWELWPHLTSEADAEGVDALKRSWDAYFTVLPRGTHEPYGLQELLDIMEEVTGTRAPTWHTITDEQVVEMAERMNVLRNKLFASLLYLWPLEVFDAQVDKVRQGQRVWYADGEWMVDLDFLDEVVREEEVEVGNEEDDGDENGEEDDEEANAEEDEGEEDEDDEEGHEKVPELVVGQAEVVEDPATRQTHIEQAEEGVAVSWC